MTAADEAIGLFGPDSVGWRVDRELIVLAGGSCALLMQAAHPVVAAGVAEHSTYATDPFGRLMRTLTSSFEVAFGSRSTAEATIRRVNAIHARVRGDLPDGSRYSAMDPEALLWVHATLVDTALRVHAAWVAPLSAADQQRYHEEAAEIAIRLGVPATSIPATLFELRGWMDGLVMSGHVHVTPQARAIARTILYPLPWIPRVAWDAAHLVSLATLRPDIRRGYGIGWTDARERGARRLAAASRLIVPRLPGVVRFAPDARRADRRVASARGVDAVRVADGDGAEPAALEVAGGTAPDVRD
ncbi:MAG TPA: oxygenase MpaB family protein [Candidatus Limnocylindria bacterium]|nr:oxygenase MpaB family protein [Candidatus Limnocylindria bacterium]